jgi:hypothetical protein
MSAHGTPQDWHEIEQVLARFCSAVDRMDFALLRTCFHPGARTNFGAFVNGSVEEYLEFASDDGLPDLRYERGAAAPA